MVLSTPGNLGTLAIVYVFTIFTCCFGVLSCMILQSVPVCYMSEAEPLVSTSVFQQSLSQPYEDGKMTMLRGKTGVFCAPLQRAAFYDKTPTGVNRTCCH